MERYPQLIRKRYRTIFHYLGIIITGIGFFTLIPLLTLLWTQEWNHGFSFFATALIGLAIGFLLIGMARPGDTSAFTVEEGGVLVVFAWVAAIALSALPFIFSGQLGVLSAVFESVSGWTTTGLSVMDVSQTPKVFLLWRSLMQFAGGAGLAVIMLSAIIGPLGLGMYQAEGRTDQLLPHIRKSAAMIMRIYTGYIVAGILLYLLAGMPLFDAVNHSMASLSTGGFSINVNSIGEYHSVPIELITIILMLLGTTNFAIHYLLVQGKVKLVLRQGEVRLLGLLLAFFVPFMVFFVTYPLFGTIKQSARTGLFDTVSALSTTGFSTVAYSNWPDSGILVLIILMLIGGGTGSTAGGIKLYRTYLLWKSFIWDLRCRFLPRTAVVKNAIWRGEERVFVDAEHIKQVGNFVVLYLATYLFGVMALAVQNIPLRQAMFEFASALGTVGLSIGITGPGSPAGVLVTEIIGMLLGRLEFIVFFFALVKLFSDWKDRRDIGVAGLSK